MNNYFVVSFDAAANLNDAGYNLRDEDKELESYRDAWHSAFTSLVKLAGVDADFYDTVTNSLDEFEHATRTDLGDDEPTFESHLWQSACDCVFFDEEDECWYSCEDDEMDEEVESIKRLYEKGLASRE